MTLIAKDGDSSRARTTFTAITRPRSMADLPAFMSASHPLRRLNTVRACLHNSAPVTHIQGSDYCWLGRCRSQLQDHIRPTAHKHDQRCCRRRVVGCRWRVCAEVTQCMQGRPRGHGRLPLQQCAAEGEGTVERQGDDCLSCTLADHVMVQGTIVSFDADHFHDDVARLVSRSDVIRLPKYDRQE